MEKRNNDKFVVTIGRQFGSGGREFGRRLAARLNIGYYDKELMTEAARHSGLRKELFDNNDERVPGYINGLFSFAMGYAPTTYFSGTTAISDDNIYRAQSDFIRYLAENESCVIVGRTADYVLRDRDNVASLFVHAPMEECVARIMAREPEHTNPARIRSRAERVNKLRANYYNFYTDKVWGAASSYDMTFDTSLLAMDDLVEIAARYVIARFPWAFEPVQDGK